MSSIWPPLWLSLRIATLATLVAIAVGVPLALLTARRRFVGRSLLDAMVLLPMVLPPTVVGYVLLRLLGGRGWLSSLLGGYSITFRFEGAVLAAAIVALPMLYLPAKAAFGAVEREMEEIARLSGAGRLATFWHVSLPLARRGLGSGIVLAFARALGEFGATVMVFGWQPDQLTLPVSVYAAHEHGRLGDASVAVVALAAISLGLVLVYNATAAARQEGSR